MAKKEPWPFRLLRCTFWLTFRTLFRIEFHGRENLPAQGPCIIAPNHRTFFDPFIVGLGIPTLCHYMTWDRLFDIPVGGWIIRRLGAYPVDMTRPDKSAYKQTLELLQQGSFVVIFPEGGRTRAMPLEELKSGVARLALASGAALVPCTILGGEKVWPTTQRFPRPGKIRVYYHPRVDVRAELASDPESEKAHVAEIMATLRARILSPMP